MISRHCQHEQMRRDLQEKAMQEMSDISQKYEWSKHLARRDIRCSSDPQWQRDRLGVHQYSRTFIIVLWFIGFMAAWGIFVATASL